MMYTMCDTKYLLFPFQTFHVKIPWLQRKTDHYYHYDKTDVTGMIIENLSLYHVIHIVEN